MNQIYRETSLVIAAAGLGTRMGPDYPPKALVHFKDKALIDWVMSSFNEKIKNVIVVIREEHKELFMQHFLKYRPLNILFTYQNIASGTAYAVQSALKEVDTEYTLVAWGDHIGASKFPTEDFFAYFESNRPDFLLPMVFRRSPYVYFERSPRTNFLEFYETRRGARRLDYGFSDCGVFLFKSARVKEFLDSKLLINAKEQTLDLNFLTLFASMQESGITFSEKQYNDVALTYGVNSRQELHHLQEFFQGSND
jgi:NDP-sugar pyrophosphorylase family protein